MQTRTSTVLGIVGCSGSGKTTLLAAVLPLLRAAGLSVSAITYARHGFDMDQPGKDSHRHRLAGAHEVLISSSRRWALLHEAAGAQPDLSDLLARMAPVDLVLVEGFNAYPKAKPGYPRLNYPRLEVFRPVLGQPSMWDQEPEVVAVASDSTPDIGERTLLPLNAPATIAAWIRTHVVTDIAPGS